MTNESTARAGTPIQLVHRGTASVTDSESRNIPIRIGGEQDLRGSVQPHQVGTNGKAGNVGNGVMRRRWNHHKFMRDLSKLTEAKRMGRKIYARRLSKEPFRRLQNAASVERSRKKNPERTRARQIVAYAIKSGKLIRPDHCQNCNTPCHPDAHHEDYSKPLEVIFLCDDCRGKTRLTSIRSRHAKLTFPLPPQNPMKTKI